MQAVLDRACAEHNLFLTALTGAYLSDASAGVQASPKRVSDFARRALDLTGAYIQTMRDIAQRAVDEFDQAGDPELHHQLANRARTLTAELQRLATENAHQLMRQLRGQSVDFSGYAASGAVGLLVQQRMARPQFVNTDTAQRRWDAGRLVRLLVRDFLYQSQIDVQVAEAARLSDQAQVRHERAEHQHCGMRVSLTGKHPHLPFIGQVRDTVFHVNATSWIEAC